MQLISLYISGFKSFANETKIQFAPGVTGVVGPNGCGKSNVVDSLRWVLGEQRSSVLRGERMENVIFNGTVKRKPMNLSEVRVKFDNSSGRINLPYGEIEIARKLHRDGTSEYLINNNSCRLRDITDMLQDSGLGPNAYTILELKMIEDILREEGEGRRQLFEEASGIAKYKLRRRQALAKLEQTNDDLLRLADIITEVERQVATLKRQVSRARRYQELTAELKTAETAFAVLEFYRIVAEITPMKQALADATSRAEGNVSYLRHYEAQVEKLRSEQIESDQQLQSFRQALQETVASISALEAEKAGTEARLTAARETLERAQRQVILSKDRLTTLEARREGLAKDVSESETELSAARGVMQEAVKRFEASQAALKQLETSYRETDARLAGLNKTQSGLENERAKLLEGVARQKGRRDSAHHSREQVAYERAELESKAGETQSALQLAERALENTRVTHDEYEGKGVALQGNQADIEQKLQELDRIQHATQSHINLLKTLEQRGPRASAPIKLLREKLTALSLVADVAVIDQKFSKAIHAALGDLAYHVVVENLGKLNEAIEVLQRGEVGRCGFLIADVVSVQDLPEVPRQALGWAGSYIDLIGHEHPVSALLNRCLIVEDLEHAFQLKDFLKAHRARAVALTGEWVDWSGACYVGQVDSDAPSDLGLSKQLENLTQTLENLRFDRETLTKELGNAKAEYAAWKKRLSELTVAVEAARTQFDRRRAESMRIETLMHALKQRDQAAVQLITESDEAERNLKQDIERILAAIEESRTEIADSQKDVEALSSDVWQARQDNASARDQHHEAARALDNVQHRRELLDAEAERVQTTEAELQDAIRSSAEQAEVAANTIRDSEALLKEISQRMGDLFRVRDERYKVVDEAQRGKDAARGEVYAMEEQLKKLRTNREAAIDDQRKLEIAIAKHEGELESLAGNARAQYSIELSLDSQPDEIAKLRAVNTSYEVISELRTKIENLGSVNLLAVEEYDRETQRLESMLTNRADLLQAKATLEETIRKINETAEAKFLHTFEAVRANFQSLFTEFFPAGEADLILSGKDLLEADITMWANPSGKRLKSLTLMSGGEKTMTAIALLFSLYQVKPSPFCVLDEVDAPLDDANIDRFTRMIHRHSDHTQFIMITHNKRTMEIADNLYGVTMQEEGVSKTVSVRLLRPVETQPEPSVDLATG